MNVKGRKKKEQEDCNNIVGALTLKRSGPTGGLAYGMPLKLKNFFSHLDVSSCPRRMPCATVTVTVGASVILDQPLTLMSQRLL